MRGEWTPVCETRCGVLTTVDSRVRRRVRRCYEASRGRCEARRRQRAGRMQEMGCARSEGRGRVVVHEGIRSRVRAIPGVRGVVRAQAVVVSAQGRLPGSIAPSVGREARRSAVRNCRSAHRRCTVAQSSRSVGRTQTKRHAPLGVDTGDGPLLLLCGARRDVHRAAPSKTRHSRPARVHRGRHCRYARVRWSNM